MGLLARAGDVYYTFRFLRLLTTPWTEMGAYKLGLIDSKGGILRKPETDEERTKYGLFHRLVFNLKKLINKVPLGKSTLASYIAALYLIKEETGISDASLRRILHETTGIDIAPGVSLLECNSWNLTEDGTQLRPGDYELARDIALPSTGELLAVKHSRVRIAEDTNAHGFIFGIPVYEAFHHRLQKSIYVTQHDLNA